jgi:ATP-dependent Lhr-like helicase
VKRIRRWFRARGWKPFAFQREVWKAYRRGESGLIHAATGTGKTYAAYFGPLSEALERKSAEPGLKLLWLTPLRALAADTEEALRLPLAELGLDWRVESRTGDTPAKLRARQRKQLPEVLLTTPESLSLQLSYEDARERFAGLEAAIVDEWHELLGSKRGVQAELCLARLRRWLPDLRIWGLSATLGNLEEACEALLGPGSRGRLVRGEEPKEIVVDALLPETVERFPWSGHLGLNLLGGVVKALEEARTALVFTNTRSQAEIWYQALLEARPDWAGLMALHHGSLDRKAREWVEANLRAGALRCVVCTSSLDLGVDFSAVDRVLQIGSPKGVARLLQRAGRSGHQPGAVSRVTCVPAHAFELVEVAAAREAIKAGRLEARLPLEKPLDLLTQHMMTVAAGGGFRSAELFGEVRTAYAYRGLTAEEWGWALDFLVTGGGALNAYPDYRKLLPDESGVYRVASKHLERRHRMTIGTIASESSLRVQYLRGGTLGHVEEYFLSRLAPGAPFVFAGKVLELVAIREMTAYVRNAQGFRGAVPQWMGSRMPLSSQLSESVREKIEEARQGVFRGPEMERVRPMLELQTRCSRLPARDELLVEKLVLPDGYHVFLFPFEGLLVHEGLAALLPYRISKLRPISLSTTATDYGIEIVSPEPAPVEEAIAAGLFRTDGLEEDIASCINAAEMAKRQFREVARVAGLVFPGYPGQAKAARQLQASAGLIHDVLNEYDPGNLLLRQARREVLDTNLERDRLKRALGRLSRARIVYVDLERCSPLAFPVLADRLRGSKVSSEKLNDRVRRMAMQLEKSAS